MAPASEKKSNGVVQVVPLLRLRHLGDRRFDYLVPTDFADLVQVGSVVYAPFGRRTVRAVVVRRDDQPAPVTGDLRPISAVSEDRVPGELLDLACLMSARYLSSFESCLRLVAPPASTPRTMRKDGTRHTWVVPVGRPADGLNASDVEPGITAQAGRLTDKQRALLEAIPPGGIATAGLCRSVGVGPGVLRRLAAKGLVELHVGAPTVRAAAAQAQGDSTAVDSGRSGPLEGPQLWPEQDQAVRDLVAAFETPGLALRQLWGVTGSGKTEVYLRLIAHAVDEGAAAILLVPEIALTSQMIGRVRARFGGRVGVFHSGLARGERLREYRRMASGDVRVVVGARSAVFAPVENVRLIIIDESHDSSYKQEEEPRYQARVAAELRLGSGGGLLLEGSATPAVENMQQPAELLKLTHRASGSMPECVAVDMRREGRDLLLAPSSRETLAATLRRGEQAIVLLNRRGFAGHVHCDLCGHVMMCEDCELSLTYHRRELRLLCHHCGRVYTQPVVCPSCGGAPLVRGAPGTERLDRELRSLVPWERVFRMDSDVMTSGTRAQAVLEEFASSRPGVLVGTQMVAKGHDFADVTLVVVADADTGLYLPDFRAAERTFQLLTQVAGRAGRAERTGRVLVQTWNPDVPCIRMALERDEEGFYRQELESRKRLKYPPFTFLIRMVTVAREGQRAQLGAQYLVEKLSRHFPAEELRGPARLPTLRGRRRWHLVVAARDGARAREIVGKALAGLREPYRRRAVTLLVDVDPQSFG